MEEPTDDLTVLSKAISHLEAVEEELGRLEKMAVLNDEDILDLLDVKQTNPIKRLYFS